MQIIPLGPGLRSSSAGGMGAKLFGAASVTLLAATISTVCSWATGKALAIDIARPRLATRSLRMDLARPLDELDLPRSRMRQTNRGWEIRTKHFVVFSTIGKEKAVWAAAELESVWSDVSALADQWSDKHRDQAFGIGAVGVLLTDSRYRSGAQPTAGPPEAKRGTTINLNAGSEPTPIEERAPQLRREGVAAFLRVTGQDQALPEWVQAGLASYFSGEEPSGEGIRTTLPARMMASPRTANWSHRSSPGSVAASGPDPVESALWVRYLLEGNDGRHAPQFFDAMSRALATSGPKPHMSRNHRHNPRSSAGPSQGADWSPLEQLTTESTLTQGMTRWLANRRQGQPTVRPEPEDMTLDQRHDRMILILKLARRFAAPSRESLRPKVSEFGDGVATTVVSMPPKESALTPIALYRRLTELPRWATIDTDGTLLISDNRQRLAEIFAVSGQNMRYRTFRRDGQTVLEAVFPDTGETIEAWLEEDPDNPERPIGHIRRAGQVLTESPAEPLAENGFGEASVGTR